MAREGFWGTEGTFFIRSFPLWWITKSVKVPPVSTPILNLFIIKGIFIFKGETKSREESRMDRKQNRARGKKVKGVKRAENLG